MISPNRPNASPQVQVSQKPNSDHFPNQPVQVDLLNALTPVASLIVLGIVGKLLIR